MALDPKNCFIGVGGNGTANLPKLLKNIRNPLPFRFFLSIKKEQRKEGREGGRMGGREGGKREGIEEERKKENLSFR